MSDGGVDVLCNCGEDYEKVEDVCKGKWICWPIELLNVYFHYMYTFITCILLLHVYCYYMHTVISCILLLHAHCYYLHDVIACILLLHVYFYYMYNFIKCILLFHPLCQYHVSCYRMDIAIVLSIYSYSMLYFICTVSTCIRIYHYCYYIFTVIVYIHWYCVDTAITCELLPYRLHYPLLWIIVYVYLFYDSHSDTHFGIRKD